MRMIWLIGLLAFAQTPATDGTARAWEAFQSMKELRYYHAKATLRTAGSAAVATVEGDVGPGFARIETLGFDGKRSWNQLTNESRKMSVDGGKSWENDSQDAGLTRYQFLAGPLIVEYPKDTRFEIVGEEPVGPEKTMATHLVAKTKTPLHIWVARDPGLGRWVLVRAVVLYEGTDARDIEASIEYSALNRAFSL